VKIAINTRFLLPGQLEGFGWYTHEIIRRMVAQHPEDEFLFLFDRAYDPRFVYGTNVTPVELFPQARHPLLFRWWFEWSVPRALKKHQADVFFSPDSMCSLRADTPTVMTCHDLVPLHTPSQVEKRHRAYLLQYLPKWLQRADKVLTVSQFVRNDIATTCNIPLDKIVSVYNACRDSFTPLPPEAIQAVRDQYSAGQPYFFYAGAIHPRKNVHRLIRAFDAFKTQTGASVKLLLAGRFAWQAGEVRAAWEQANHRDDILFLGYLDDDVLPRLTASALALAYVSLSEGFGLPLVEAMACDVPVITSDASCLPEVAGEAALLVDPLSEAAIAKGLQSIYSDQALVATLVARGRRRRQDFSWDTAAAEVYAVLQETALRGKKNL
jgi:glycosyltransferase involved in cell wall biosynthesis